MASRKLPEHGRVLFTATLVRGHIEKFHVPYLRWFKEQGWETWVAAKNDYPDGACDIPCCDRFVDVDFARSPFSARTAVAYRQLRELFASERFDIVHTHTPVGSVLTRLAARDARRGGTKVVYTAHGFHFYDGAPPANWLLWYPVERAMSRLTDVLVTINREDYGRAKRFARCRVEYVPGVGIDTSIFRALKASNDKGDVQERWRLRESYGMREGCRVLLSVGDLNENKNHVLLIDALGLLPAEYELYIVGDGPLHAQLEAHAKEKGLLERVHLLGFRSDVESLLNACDVFCFPSRREGLPVSLLEAMATGTPCVCSSARGCADLLGEYADVCMVGKSDANEFADRVLTFARQNDLAAFSKGLCARSQLFDLDATLHLYAGVYERVLFGLRDGSVARRRSFPR